MMKKCTCESEKNNGRIERIFQKFSGHCLDNFTSIEKFTVFLHKPVDGASLGIGRMSFGLMMLIDIPEERSGGDLDYRWGNPRDCRFPLFNFLAPLSLPWMGIIYGLMWLGALGIFLGYKYRLSCLMFTIPYWYIFFLDKSRWNNHSYLYGLLGILFTFTTSANKYWALDAETATNGYRDTKVPLWNYFIIKFQFFILYFMAGVKKFSTEWLSGYAMANLGYHWVFAPFRLVLGAKLTDLLIIHWFGFVFDLTIAFFLIWKRSRPLATLVAAVFHLMNSRLFRIGMFPWVCLVEMPLFYSVDWPRRILSGSEERELQESAVKAQSSRKERIRTRWIMFYMGLQFFLPYSHFITKGYNNWTEGLYGYSWDMMVHSWDTVLITIKVVDQSNRQTFYLEPYGLSDNDRWTKHADMAIQYAQCLKEDLIQRTADTKTKDFNLEDIAIYFDIWCSMNKRFQQRIFDPTVNMLRADWSPFRLTKWIMPLLGELSHLRPRMREITEEVQTWNNFTDVMFIADFPGLEMESYINTDLDNITITCLDGNILLTSVQTESVTLSQGQSMKLSPGIFHKVRVVSAIPACYMYIYQNQTMKHLREEENLPPEKTHPLFPILQEITHRWDNFVKFFVHVANSLFHQIDRTVPLEEA